MIINLIINPLTLAENLGQTLVSDQNRPLIVGRDESWINVPKNSCSLSPALHYIITANPPTKYVSHHI